MALEHVAQGQTRFFTPGVAPDPRGILLGRFCLMTFPTLEGAVSWLRLYSAEASLDELMANLAITKARTALGSREIVIQIPAVSSYAADRAARLARALGPVRGQRERGARTAFPPTGGCASHSER